MAPRIKDHQSLFSHSLSFESIALSLSLVFHPHCTLLPPPSLSFSVFIAGRFLLHFWRNGTHAFTIWFPNFRNIQFNSLVPVNLKLQKNRIINALERNVWINQCIKVMEIEIWNVQANAASGMAVSDECKLKFQELKAKRTYRFIVFKIEEQQVVVEKVGGPNESYDDFTSSLPSNECRYAVYDFDFTTDENCQKSKIFFIAWYVPLLPLSLFKDPRFDPQKWYW